MSVEYTNIDQLHEFLKSIRTVDEFFEKKKPGFRDWYDREMVNALIEQSHSTKGDMLLALKQSEKQRFVEERRFEEIALLYQF